MLVTTSDINANLIPTWNIAFGPDIPEAQSACRVLLDSYEEDETMSAWCYRKLVFRCRAIGDDRLVARVAWWGAV